MLEGPADPAYRTGPRVSMVVLVSVSNGVDARIHTPPSRSLIAVERPPTGNNPNRANGLQDPGIGLRLSGVAGKCNGSHLEKIHTPFVTLGN